MTKSKNSIDKETTIIEIKINSRMSKLVPAYFDARKSEIDIMKSFCRNEMWTDLKVIAHKMLGTGQSYGFIEISRFGIEIEEACKKKDKENCTRLIEDYAIFMDKVILVE